MFDNLRADFQAALGHRTQERGMLRVLLRLETPAIVCYRYSHWVTNLRIPVVRILLLIPALILQRMVQIFLGIFISPDAEIGPGLVIHTPYAINVAPVKIGPNCTIQSGVLIGAGVRSVGENVYFGAGCKIIGDVKIGNNVVIVANSVVLTDVADNTTIMGVPARIKLRGGRPRRFAWQAGKKPIEQKPVAASSGQAGPTVASSVQVSSTQANSSQVSSAAAGAAPTNHNSNTPVEIKG
jgi:serine O-acetyltransferase